MRDPQPEMIRLTDLAALRGIGKAAMSERVAKYAAAGLLYPVREGRTKMIRLAEFEAAEATAGNLSRMAGAATKRARVVAGDAGLPARDDAAEFPPASAVLPREAPAPVALVDDDDLPAAPTGGYTKAQADLATYKAAIAKLDLDQRLGKVLPVTDVTEAMARCAEALVRGIDQLAAGADDIAAAVAKNGSAGARAALKAKARDLRDLLAREMRLLGAPPEAGSDEAAA